MRIATRTLFFFSILLLTSLHTEAGGIIPFGFMPLLRVIKPPTFIQEAETAWNTSTSPKTTSSFNVLAGDLLVAYAIRENDNGDLMNVSGGSLTWTRTKSVHTSTGNWCEVSIWWARVDANKSMTVSFTSSSGNFGGNVLTFRGSGGIGGGATAIVANGAPSLNVTTLKENSSLVVVNGDWNVVNGASRAWRLSPTETTYFLDSQYTAYGAYHPNIGNAGTYNVGLSVPSGQNYSIAAVEVRGDDDSDLCAGATPPIGTFCKNGAIYAGQFDGGKYMVTPGGCTDSATPTCSGSTDTLTKAYVGSSGTQGVDIAGITNIASASTKSSSAQRGDILTPLIVADASTSSDSAAHYCSNMVYGGFSDWYLPSKSELAYIYCHSDAGSSHSTSAPEEDVNCATYGTTGGPTNELPGFSGGEYTSATESDQDYRWRISFNTGNLDVSWKSFTGTFVRCVRRY